MACRKQFSCTKGNALLILLRLHLARRDPADYPVKLLIERCTLFSMILFRARWQVHSNPIAQKMLPIDCLPGIDGRCGCSLRRKEAHQRKVGQSVRTVRKVFFLPRSDIQCARHPPLPCRPMYYYTLKVRSLKLVRRRCARPLRLKRSAATLPEPVVMCFTKRVNDVERTRSRHLPHRQGQMFLCTELRRNLLAVSSKQCRI